MTFSPIYLYVNLYPSAAWSSQSKWPIGRFLRCSFSFPSVILIASPARALAQAPVPLTGLPLLSCIHEGLLYSSNWTMTNFVSFSFLFTLFLFRWLPVLPVLWSFPLLELRARCSLLPSFCRHCNDLFLALSALIYILLLHLLFSVANLHPILSLNCSRFLLLLSLTSPLSCFSPHIFLYTSPICLFNALIRLNKSVKSQSILIDPRLPFATTLIESHRSREMVTLHTTQSFWTYFIFTGYIAYSTYFTEAHFVHVFHHTATKYWAYFQWVIISQIFSKYTSKSPKVWVLQNRFTEHHCASTCSPALFSIPQFNLHNPITTCNK